MEGCLGRWNVHWWSGTQAMSERRGAAPERGFHLLTGQPHHVLAQDVGREGLRLACASRVFGGGEGRWRSKTLMQEMREEGP